MNPTMDAIYFVSPMPHIVDCLLADFDRRRYQRSFIVLTDLLEPELRRRLYSHPQARELIAVYKILNIDFFPRESHLVTFRDPWSFPVLYHPGCNHLVREHMQALAQKVGTNQKLLCSTCPQAELTWLRIDYQCMHLAGRIPESAILPTTEPFP
jgi:syntaxin-binding protein 1